MPRLYTVTVTATTAANSSGDIDWFELSPADDKPVEIVGLTAVITSETGDAADEWGSLQIIRGHTTSGSGGSTPTPGVLDAISTAAGFAAETMNTTIASAGTTVTLFADGINVRTPYAVWFPDGCGPMASQANTTILVRQSSTWADDVTVSATLFVKEYP